MTPILSQAERPTIRRILGEAFGWCGADRAAGSLTGRQPRRGSFGSTIALGACLVALPAGSSVAASTWVSAWGRNLSQQCVIPSDLTNAVAVAAGDYHSLALKADGTVATWGDNGFGQLNAPPSLNNVVRVGAGFVHSLAIKANGSVVQWGQGSLDMGDWLNVVDIAGGAFNNTGLMADGTFAVRGLFGAPQGLTGIVGIAASGYHGLAVQADGTVVAWGHDDYGESEVPSELTNVLAVASGQYHSLALKADGTVVAWGAGTVDAGAGVDWGQSVVPLDLTNVIAIAAGAYHSLALKADGTVAAWGAGTTDADNGYDYGQSIVPPGLTNVTSIAAGAYHNLAVVGLPTHQPAIANASAGLSSFSCAVPTVRGRTYTLQFTDSLSQPGWTPLAPLPGLDALRTLTDPQATNSERFYRVWVR